LCELADQTVSLELSAAGCARKPAPIVGVYLELNYKSAVNGRLLKKHVIIAIGPLQLMRSLLLLNLSSDFIAKIYVQ